MVSFIGKPRRALLLEIDRACSSFEPRRGKIQTGCPSFEGQTYIKPRPAGTLRANPARTSKRYESLTTSAKSLKQALCGQGEQLWIFAEFRC
jgi:hypothetical protein